MYFAADEPTAVASRGIRRLLERRDKNDPATIFGNNRAVPLPEVYYHRRDHEDEIKVGGLRFDLMEIDGHQTGDIMIFVDKNKNENSREGKSNE